MTVEELFTEYNHLEGNQIEVFWNDISKALNAETSYAGISANEIKAYLDLNELKYSCACGNQPYNCICYSDAE